MRKILVTIIALAVTVFSVHAADVVNIHKVTGNISGLSVSSAYKVNLKQGPVSVVTKVSPEAADYVTVKVEMGVVKIGLSLPSNLKSGRQNWNLEAEVTIPSLETLNISGAVTVNSEGTFTVNDMKAHVSGTSRISNLVIKGTEADFDVSGASTLNMDANVNELDIDVSGASTANFSGKGSDLSIDCSGASKVNGKGEFTEVSTECSGASTVNLEGKCTKFEAECAGASSVNAFNLLAENVEAEASGSSCINVNVLRKLEVELSGASFLNYKGADSVNVIQKSVSKGCSLNRK